MKTANNIKCRGECGATGSLVCGLYNENAKTVHSLWVTVWQCNINIHVSYDPKIYSWLVTQKKEKLMFTENLYMMNVLFITTTNKTTQMCSLGRMKKQTVEHPHNGMLATRSNGVWIHSPP